MAECAPELYIPMETWGGKVVREPSRKAGFFVVQVNAQGGAPRRLPEANPAPGNTRDINTM